LEKKRKKKHNKQAPEWNCDVLTY